MAKRLIFCNPLLAAFLFTVAATILLQTPAGAADKPKTLKDKYHNAQVDLFSTPEDIEFPAEYLHALQDQIITHLRESKRFTEVLPSGESPAERDAAILQVTGTVTRFKPGSRAERYFVGFGAGSTEVFGHLLFLDRSSGAVLSTADIRGRMQAGVFGGSSIAVVHDFAHRVSETTRMLLEKRLADTPAAAMTPTAAPAEVAHPPVPSESATTAAGAAPLADSLDTKAGASPLPPPVSQHFVDFSSGDFEETQKKLMTEGAAGYRIVNFTVTGAKTAHVVLEKVASSPLTYEYLVLHGRTQGGLQSRLNKQGESGFRLVPNNLAFFGGVFACIMEKPSVPGQHTYKYMLHVTVRVSSAQHDIEREQADGYTLAGSATQPYMHLVLLEKEVPLTAANAN